MSSRGKTGGGQKGENEAKEEKTTETHGYSMLRSARTEERGEGVVGSAAKVREDRGKLKGDTTLAY